MAKQIFEGLRVVDFGWVWAGTVLGHILADYGAEVIKVESKRRLDGLRLGKVFELGDTLEMNPYFHNLNRNKLSITLDITKEDAVHLIKELVRQSDLVIENFAPGVLDRRGLGYETLASVKPDIIMISLSAVGQKGPISQIVTYAPIISALSGIDSMVGYPDGPPLGFKHAYADPTASLFGAFAVLAALRYRQRTGKGQYIDLSQAESATCLIGEALMDYQMNGRIGSNRGNSSLTMAPHGHYPCDGEDRWVSIAVKTEEEWAGFCRAIGNPAWTQDPKFADRYSRLANSKELDERVAEWTREHSDYEASEILQKAGVAAAPVLGVDGIFVDEHFQSRGIFIDVEHPVVGSSFLYELPWKMSEVERKPVRHAPILGEHNDYVFGQLLGLPREEIDRLAAEEVIY